MASGQIVNFAWREGISAQDALVYFEEAKQLALALGDIRANALIHAAYGRILANGGSADEYVEKRSNYSRTTRMRNATVSATSAAWPKCDFNERDSGSQIGCLEP